MFNLRNKTDWILWARGRALNMTTGAIIYYNEGTDPDNPEPTIHVDLGPGPYGFTDPYLTHAILPWIRMACGDVIYKEFQLGIKHTREKLLGVMHDPGIESNG